VAFDLSMASLLLQSESIVKSKNPRKESKVIRPLPKRTEPLLQCAGDGHPVCRKNVPQSPRGPANDGTIYSNDGREPFDAEGARKEKKKERELKKSAQHRLTVEKYQ
jgi:hypothetical protein